MYYIVSESCIGGHFLEDCFYCYSQQFKSAVANESLIPYNLVKMGPCLFWVENCYLLTWNLAHILSNLKTFKGAIKTFWIWRDTFYWSHHVSSFLAGNLAFTCFCRLQTLVLFCLCFLAFCEFQCHFYNHTYVLTFIIKYFTSSLSGGG